MANFFNVIWKVFPFGCIAFALLLLQENKAKIIELNHLKYVVEAQKLVLVEQGDGITELNRLHHVNDELMAKLQFLMGQYQDEKTRVGREIRKEINHDTCRAVKLPDNVAKRMRQFAGGYHEP